MAQKVCKQCKAIFEGASVCPQCGSTEFTDSFKGKVMILKPEESEIAKGLKITKKGTFAVKLG